jgi:radical SAM superfamily enzyme YgiQ (UPF0313 family)
MSKKKIYLVNPKTPRNFWAMQGALDIVGPHKTLMPNSALLTLIALTPNDLPIEYIFCDENVSSIDFDAECDLVAITGYTLQFSRMQEISAKFRERGIAVAAGGIYATIDPDGVGRIADHLFIGEAEYTWPRFLADWLAGSAQAMYVQEGNVDIKDSPAPNLSYLRAGDYLYFSVQTSRGCPNDCDFCDVIRIAGRKYRSKPIENILREVENARASGAETVFFSDDNFFVNRAFSKALLEQLISYNRALSRPLSFSTQATVMIGADDEILKLLADARFSAIFLGVETTRKECLEEVNKGQMARYDPYETVRRISSHGIVPFLGMIVGFDHDTPAVFDEIEQFLDATASPIASISVLTAPPNTRLYRRMAEEGRLLEKFQGFWHLTTNFVPKGMSLEELYRGHKDLFQRIYEPERFERRMVGWLQNVTYMTALYPSSTRKKNFFRLFLIIRILKHFLFRVPGPVRRMFWNVLKAAYRKNPRLISRAMSVLVQYWHYYDFTRDDTWKRAGIEAPGELARATER